MQGPFVTCVLLALALGGNASAVTPVQKVLAMLDEMRTKAQEAMAEEQKVMAKYTEWADDQITDLGHQIESQKTQIENLLAVIDKADTDAEALAAEIAEVDAEVARMEADQKAITAERETARDEYTKAQMDYAESVDALERAIQILSQQNYDRPQAEMLLQRMAKTHRGMRRVLAVLLEEGSEVRDEADGAPAVAAYEFQSGKIIDLLKGMLSKFEKELGDLEKAEMNSQHNFEMEMLHLGNTLTDAKSSRESKAAAKAKLVAESAEAKAELENVKKDLAEDETVLKETKATLETKKEVYATNQKTRAEEIEALSKAIEIISDPAVADSYAKHINLIKTSSTVAVAPSLLEVRSGSVVKRTAVKARAAAYLRDRAGALGSKTLAEAAQHIKENPFAKVIEMVKTLIARLQEEAAAEATHKDWCDEELKNNKLIREEKAARCEMLQAEIGKLGMSITSMAEEMATLAEEQAALTKAMQEATEMRIPEKAENEAAIKDAEAAQVALKQALEVLHDFYGKPGLLQRGARKQVPELKEYKGLSGSSGGVIGMLEVIMSDFARLEADTTSAESIAQTEYMTFMTESKAMIEKKHKREFQLSLDKDQAEFEKSQLEDDLEKTQKELDAANTYFESLKPECIEVHVSYEERVKHREEEIQALQEAYRILDEAYPGL